MIEYFTLSINDNHLALYSFFLGCVRGLCSFSFFKVLAEFEEATCTCSYLFCFVVAYVYVLVGSVMLWVCGALCCVLSTLPFIFFSFERV